MQEDDNPAYGYRLASGPKVIRGRGCEESFRAAVDKEYNTDVVDPNHRSEIGKYYNEIACFEVQIYLNH